MPFAHRENRENTGAQRLKSRRIQVCSKGHLEDGEAERLDHRGVHAGRPRGHDAEDRGGAVEGAPQEVQDALLVRRRLVEPIADLYFS